MTVKESILQHVEKNGNKMRYTDIIKFVYEFNNPGMKYNWRENRGYYASAFANNMSFNYKKHQYVFRDGHLIAGKDRLVKNDDKTYSVVRNFKEND